MTLDDGITFIIGDAAIDKNEVTLFFFKLETAFFFTYSCSFPKINTLCPCQFFDWIGSLKQPKKTSQKLLPPRMKKSFPI